MRNKSWINPKSRRMLQLLVTLIVSAGATQVLAQSNFNIKEARKSVVFIKQLTPGLPPAVGSGFIVNKTGMIFTNRHVVVPENGQVTGTKLIVGVPSDTDANKLEYFPAALAYAPPANQNLDFAVLKIAAKDKTREFSKLPISKNLLDLADDVAVLGYPFVQEGQPNVAFNKGSISSSRVMISEHRYYQTDASINPGNSGGPLLNRKGEAVGIVTMQKGNADDIGFALYIDSVKAASTEAIRRSKKIKLKPGPIDIEELGVAGKIEPKKSNWKVVSGKAKETQNSLVVDNSGGTYWIASKKKLPKDFQLIINCRIEFLQGSQVVRVSQRNILRTLAIRFDTLDVKSMILETKGTVLQSSHSMMLLKKEGKDKAVEVVHEGNSDQPFLLSITRLKNKLTVAIDGKEVLSHRGRWPKGENPFCIGGYLSRLTLGDVSILDLSDE